MFDYDKLSKEDLIRIIEDSLNQTEQKHGFNWVTQPEDVVLRSEYEYPFLTEIENLAITTTGTINLLDDKSWWQLDINNEFDNKWHIPHILIEGDNYHTLTNLTYSHNESVDIIYIDGPYGTGKSDFIFNDVFVSTDDGYRVCKFSSFYGPRIKMAREVLKNTGVMLVSIDDYNIHRVRGIMDKYFGQDNFVCTFIWNRSGAGGLRKNFPVTNHEYILCYAKNKKLLENLDAKWLAPYSEKALKNFKFEDSVGVYRQQTLYIPSLKQTKNQSYFIELPDGSEARPPVGKGAWRFTKSKYTEALADNLIEFKLTTKSPLVDVDGNRVKYNIYTKQYKLSDFSNPTTILPENSVGKTLTANSELKSMGVDFDYAKPVSLIKYLIKLIPNNKNAIVLDFFAGSGTTGQAVLELNKEDGGNRQFILCTNNEGDICTKICYPRLVKIIEGYTKLNGEQVPGIIANLRYYKTDFVKRSDNIDQMKHNLLNKVDELVCLKEGIYEEKESLYIDDKLFYKIFIHGQKALGILYNTFDACFVKELNFKLMKYDSSVLYTVDDFLDGVDESIRIELLYDDLIDTYKKLFK